MPAPERLSSACGTVGAVTSRVGQGLAAPRTHVVMDTITDARGNVHAPAGSPAAGQFTTKTHTAPIADLEAPGVERTDRHGASLTRGNFGGFALTNVRTMRGTEGEAFSAYLTLDGQRVGELIQEGDGGDTWCRWSSVDAQQRFGDLVATEWDFTWDYGDGGHYDHSVDSVLEALYEEAAFRKELANQRRVGKLPIMTTADVAMMEDSSSIASYRLVNGGVGAESSVHADLTSAGEADGAVYWDGDAWKPFTS